MRTLLATLACVFLSGGPASAGKMTAICRDISGIRVDEERGNIVRANDGLVDVTWSYSGDDDTGNGTLILQSSRLAGGRVSTERVFVKRMLSDHWTFVSLLDDATWVHSIYPRSGKLLVTQNTSTATMDLAGKLMTGTCKVTVR